MATEFHEDSVIERTHERWVGKCVRIRSRYGSLDLAQDGNQLVTSHTSHALFEIVRVAPVGASSESRVAFRVKDSDQYITAVLYGDAPRQNILEALVEETALPPEMLRQVVGYAVEDASPTDNFEGAGFNYSPMTVEPGPINAMRQSFQMEDSNGGRFGLRSCFNTYWRSQHWENTVSQSPHRLGDELWYIKEASN